jgi:hypothetical protein
MWVMRILTDCIDSVREQDKTHHDLSSEIDPSTLLNISGWVNSALFTGQHKAGNISSDGKSVSLKFLERTSLASIQGSTLVSYMLMNNNCFDTHHDNWDWPFLIHAFIYLKRHVVALVTSCFTFQCRRIVSYTPKICSVGRNLWAGTSFLPRGQSTCSKRMFVYWGKRV